MDIGGKPLLTRLLNRLRRTVVEDVILATTTRKRDDILIRWAKREGITYYRGDEDDVLQRIVDAHRKMRSDVVVRICGDTPLIDPGGINLLIKEVTSGRYQVAKMKRDRTFPHGIAGEVCLLKDLWELSKTVTDPVLREHVTLHLYESGKYKVFEFPGKPNWECENQRLQVDYHEDMEAVRIIHERLGPNDDYGVADIVGLLRREPWIRGINGHCEEKPIR